MAIEAPRDKPPQTEFVSSPAEITFERYTPPIEIDPLNLMPLYGMNVETVDGKTMERSTDSMQEEIDRRFGPKRLYEDTEHERGTRAIDLGVQRFMETGRAPDVLFVVTSHLPDKEGDGENQRIANRIRDAIDKKASELGVDSPNPEVTPQNTRTVSAACSGFVVALHELRQLNPIGESVEIDIDETNYRETLPEPKNDPGRSNFLMSDFAIQMNIENYGRDFKVLSSDVRYEGDPEGHLGMDVPEVNEDDPFMTVYSPPQADNFDMNGPELLKHFQARITKGEIERLLQEADNTDISEIKYFICHQASSRMVAHFNKMFPDVEFSVNVDPKDKAKKERGIVKYGNTSAASIPIVMEDAIDDGELPPGKGFLLAFGGGLTWAAGVVERKAA